MESWANQLKSITAKVKQMALNLTDTQMKVEEATNSDPWGPHGSLMSEIAKLSYDPEKYKEIMEVLAQRLTSPDEFRHVYKALLLLEFLAKHGPMKVVHELQGNLPFLEQLKEYKFVDKAGQDCGLNVRHRAKELAALISDQQRILEEREVAQKNKSKYGGVGRDELYGRIGGFGGSKSGFSSTGSSIGDSGGFGVSYDNRSRSSTAPETASVTDRVAPEKQEDNPFEATRKRIEKLKREGAIDCEKDPEPRPRTPPLVAQPGKLEAEKRKGPKTLSQVKVNPDIAKTFLTSSLSASMAAGSATAPGSTNQTAIKPRDAGDLLGELNVAFTDSVTTGIDELAGHSGAGIDLLGAPVLQQTTNGGDDWSAFAAGDSREQNAQDPFVGLAAETPATATQQGTQPTPVTTPADDFADFVGGSLAPPSQQADPFTILDTGGASPQPGTGNRTVQSGVGPGVAAQEALPADLFLTVPAASQGSFPAMMGVMQQGSQGLVGTLGTTAGHASINAPPGTVQAGVQVSYTPGVGSLVPDPVNQARLGVHTGLTGAFPSGISLKAGPLMTTGGGAAVPTAGSGAVTGGNGPGSTKGGLSSAMMDSGLPMRPGAARPAPTIAKKDPFADLKVL